jgi:hypothetical protein
MKFFNTLKIKFFIHFQTFLKGLDVKLSVESVEENLDEIFSGNIDKTAELINRYLS